MPTISRVVAGYDGSPGSVAAVGLAAAEADAAGAVLRIVHAQLARSAYAYLAPPGAVGDAAVEARRLVDTVREALLRAHPGLVVRTVVTTVSPGAALIRAARSADLLVIGRGGHAAFGPADHHRPPSGAIAAHVLAYAGCPVVIVGADAATASEPDGSRPVVLSFDPRTTPAAAVQHAFSAAERRGTGLRVCYVRRPDGQPWPDDAEARRVLSEALAPWRAAFADVPVAVEVLTGLDPAAQLLDASTGAALVVVAEAPAAGRPSRLPDVLIHNAACPVAVVPAQAARAALRPIPVG
ncbi:universal stress protein [Dactylosporangium sp. CA-092794]|uniref:universal stress protein n=1 Tax=Dactylosporangium sp. CA-092794 TaxID=3239929 RepID=UPI003D8EFDD0